MKTTSTPFKPSLEQLEDRVQPSFLLGGGVQQLAAPLQNMVKDMQSAQTDFINQVQAGVNAKTQTQGAIALSKASADFQRLENDQHAIQATSNADVSFINAVAFSELMSGDATDLVILKFGSIIGLNPTKALTDPVNQADQIMKDPTLNNSVTTLNGILTLGSTSLTDLAPPPSAF